MLRNVITTIATVLVLSFVPACSGNDDGPSGAQIAGSWSGTFESNYTPEAIFVDVTQVSEHVTGTWAMQSGIRAAGTISGDVSKTNFTGIITYSFTGGPVCQASFSGGANSSSMTWTSPGFTGSCGLSSPGNPTNVRFVLQRR